MKKLFEEYGGVITTVIAIVALIGIISLTIAGPNGGWVGGAFSDVIDKFSEKTTIALADGPVMLDGDGQVLNALEPKAFSFRSSAPIEEFKEVRVDGVVVDESNYTVKSGSTIVTFNEEYSEVLSTGEHSVEIVSESGSATGDFSVALAVEAGAKIPEGCTYTPNGGTALSAGETIPAIQDGDIFTTADYEYTYHATQKPNIVWRVGWSISPIDRKKTEYEEIYSCINGQPLTNMYAAFKGCSKLTVAPIIPNCVVDMDYAFADCTSLKIAPPEIPSSVKNMSWTFDGCTSLTTAPVINNSPAEMTKTFYNCSNLKTYHGSTDADGDFSNYKLPDSITYMWATFTKCTSLKVAPILPNNIPSLTYVFKNCTSLTTAPIIPNSVSIMDDTFVGCSNLKTYHGSTDADGDFSGYIIPNSVVNMSYAFENCTSLKIAPVLPSSVNILSNTFSGCTSLTTAPVIPENVTKINGLFYNCTALTGTIEINANPSNYNACFQKVDFVAQNLKLTGSSTILEDIFGTSYCSICQGTCTQTHEPVWKDDLGWF